MKNIPVFSLDEYECHWLVLTNQESLRKRVSEGSWISNHPGDLLIEGCLDYINRGEKTCQLWVAPIPMKRVLICIRVEKFS